MLLSLDKVATIDPNLFFSVNVSPLIENEAAATRASLI